MQTIYRAVGQDHPSPGDQPFIPMEKNLIGNVYAQSPCGVFAQCCRSHDIGRIIGFQFHGISGTAFLGKNKAVVQITLYDYHIVLHIRDEGRIDLGTVRIFYAVFRQYLAHMRCAVVVSPPPRNISKTVSPWQNRKNLILCCIYHLHILDTIENGGLSTTTQFPE